MSIIFAILIFSFLIFIHEFGHFITAKLSGVQVNEFAMFMGPAIWKKQKGETLYSIRCIPIGGYCAMEGEDKDTDNPRSFQKAAWWKRLIILVAGSAMNFIAGILIMVIVFLPAQQFITPTISNIEQGSLIGGTNGLQVGDTLLEVDGEVHRGLSREKTTLLHDQLLSGADLKGTDGAGEAGGKRDQSRAALGGVAVQKQGIAGKHAPQRLSQSSAGGGLHLHVGGHPAHAAPLGDHRLARLQLADRHRQRSALNLKFHIRSPFSAEKFIYLKL